jgi:phenylalanyl-tRNA synthetase beta chain
MRLLVSWVRDFVGVTVSPREIADTLALRGFEVASIEPAPDGVRPPWRQSADGADAVIDFEVTANRPDCLSVLGFAREIATAYDLPLNAPALPSTAATPSEPSAAAELALQVVLEDAERCPRYAAALAEVSGGVSPLWMTARLQAAGIRPISPFVDITNYVLIELGHPMHAFDLARLAGGEIRIRRAARGETMTTLDGAERALEPDMLVIADGARPQAIAGVMGGAMSEVSAATRVVAFESACFQPASVRRTSKRLGLKTEASSRFERGVDVNAPVVALERALQLAAFLGVGKRIGRVIDRYPTPRGPRAIHLRRERIRLLLGLAVSDAETARILSALGLATAATADGWDVTVPTFRVDLLREVDLIEEVGRHYGFDKLEPTFPAMTAAAPAPDPRVLRDGLLRRVATAAGLSEAVTFGFIESGFARAFVGPDRGGRDGPDGFGPDGPGRIDEGDELLVRVANPLSAKFDALRPSLLPGLIDVVAHNRRHGRRDVGVFEIGATFAATNGERRRVALAWTGAALAEHWSKSGREVDFFDVKGLVERLGEVVDTPVRLSPTTVPYLVAGQTAVARSGTVSIGLIGLLSPKVAETRGAPRQDKIFVAELDLDTMTRLGREREPAVQPLPRFPSIVRDLSMVVSERLSAEIIRGTIQAAATDIDAPLVSIAFFDRYKGKGVSEDAVSVSVRLTFQAVDRTLIDADVQRSFDGIVAALVHQHGAVRR